MKPVKSVQSDGKLQEEFRNAYKHFPELDADGPTEDRVREIVREELAKAALDPIHARLCVEK